MKKLSNICNKCKTEVGDSGATLISPPDEDGVSIKFHLCRSCYKVVEKQLV